MLESKDGSLYNRLSDSNEDARHLSHEVSKSELRNYASLSVRSAGSAQTLQNTRLGSSAS